MTLAWILWLDGSDGHHCLAWNGWSCQLHWLWLDLLVHGYTPQCRTESSERGAQSFLWPGLMLLLVLG